MLFLLVFGMITCVFIPKQLFASGSVIIREYSPRLHLGEYSPVIIGEYSPRLRLGEYSPIITEAEANNC